MQIINVTPHAITFDLPNFDSETTSIPPCGVVISATPVEEPAGELFTLCAHDLTGEVCAGCNGTGEARVLLVRTRFVASPEAEAQLAALEAANPHALIVGSIIAAQAFPDRVLAMVPAPGFERVEPAQKRMRADKFTTFAPATVVAGV